MKKLIQFKNIVKEFDGQLVLRGINLGIDPLLAEIIKNRLREAGIE